MNPIRHHGQRPGVRAGLTRRGFLAGAAAVGGGVIAGSMLAGCSGAQRPSTTLGTGPVGGSGKPLPQLTWAISGDIVSLDPARAFDFNSGVLVGNVTESLFRLDPAGKPSPNLATSYATPTPTTLVLQLRNGVKFHDGSPMTAEDVAYSLSRNKSPDVGSYVGYFFDRVTSIVATGPSEVTISLSAPDDRLVPALGTTAGAIVSRAFMEHNGARAGTPSVGIVGTGPYRFVSWRQGESATLERNPDYWNFAGRTMAVERFVVQVLTQESTIVQGLQSGSIDGAFESALSGQAIAHLASTPRLQLNRVDGAGTMLLSYNEATPPFNDPRVRNAVSLCIDKAGILQSTWGGIGKLINSMSPPSLWTYDNAQFAKAYASYPDYKPDLIKAKSLVEQANAVGASSDIWVADDPTKAQALSISQSAAQIGLTLNVHSVTSDDLLRATQNSGGPSPYGLAIYPVVADLMDPYGILGFNYTTTGSTNGMSYSNKAVDGDLFTSITDPVNRAGLIISAEKLIYDDAPASVLYTPDACLIHNARFGGYEMRPLWSWDSYVADFSGN